MYALRRALERLREEYKADSESLAHSEAISIMRLVLSTSQNQDDNVVLAWKTKILLSWTNDDI